MGGPSRSKLSVTLTAPDSPTTTHSATPNHSLYQPAASHRGASTAHRPACCDFCRLPAFHHAGPRQGFSFGCGHIPCTNSVPAGHHTPHRHRSCAHALVLCGFKNQLRQLHPANTRPCLPRLLLTTALLLHPSPGICSSLPGSRPTICPSIPIRVTQ